MAKRKALSKRVRFSVFARDAFTCRYCGRTSSEVALAIDHIVPVVQGGGNEEANLATACVDCNGGKAARLISQAPEAATAQLAREQELREAELAAEVTRAAVETRRHARQMWVDYWCDVRNQNDVDPNVISLLMSFAEQHGAKVVAEWVDMAHSRLPGKPDYRLAKYISGIRRNFRDEGKL